MPRYDYQCAVCGETTEQQHSMKEERDVVCKCGNQMEKLISPCAVKFVGPGFYENDYKKKSGPSE